MLLRNVWHTDRFRRLDALYRVEDPWGMSGDEEQGRFDETNHLIEKNIGRVGTLLEIGCGEGHQSSKLLSICDRLYGLDVSDRAVRRAMNRCPTSTFGVGDVFSCDFLNDGAVFDLVVACEVLYYVKDVPATLARLSVLGRWCFVTYYEPRATGLDAHLSCLPGVQFGEIRVGATKWKACWWRNNLIRDGMIRE